MHTQVSPRCSGHGTPLAANSLFSSAAPVKRTSEPGATFKALEAAFDTCTRSGRSSSSRPVACDRPKPTESLVERPGQGGAGEGSIEPTTRAASDSISLTKSSAGACSLRSQSVSSDQHRPRRSSPNLRDGVRQTA